jgi:hypothetical protein
MASCKTRYFPFWVQNGRTPDSVLHLSACTTFQRCNTNKSARNISISTVHSKPQVLKLVIINHHKVSWMIWKHSATNTALYTDRYFHVSSVTNQNSFNIRTQFWRHFLGVQYVKRGYKRHYKRCKFLIGAREEQWIDCWQLPNVPQAFTDKNTLDYP